MLHHGSCHCGKIAFTVEGDVDGVIECNCSICSRRGALLWFMPRAAFTLTTPEGDLSTYRFNKGHIAHHFCATCGCAPYGAGSAPDGTQTVALNVRCLDAIDLKAPDLTPYDGRSL